MFNKVLFLDIDGVVCTPRAHMALDPESAVMRKFDPIAVRLIRSVCEKTGCKIVLSSSWRLQNTWEAELHRQGLWNQLFHEDKQTCDPRLNDVRGNEIKEWLSRHPEVEKYAIIDDNTDMLEDQKPFFVQTVMWDGISYFDHKKLISILGEL